MPVTLEAFVPSLDFGLRLLLFVWLKHVYFGRFCIFFISCFCDVSTFMLFNVLVLTPPKKNKIMPVMLEAFTWRLASVVPCFMHGSKLTPTTKTCHVFFFPFILWRFNVYGLRTCIWADFSFFHFVFLSRFDIYAIQCITISKITQKKLN